MTSLFSGPATAELVRCARLQLSPLRLLAVPLILFLVFAGALAADDLGTDLFSLWFPGTSTDLAVDLEGVVHDTTWWVLLLTGVFWIPRASLTAILSDHDLRTWDFHRLSVASPARFAVARFTGGLLYPGYALLCTAGFLLVSAIATGLFAEPRFLLAHAFYWGFTGLCFLAGAGTTHLFGYALGASRIRGSTLLAYASGVLLAGTSYVLFTQHYETPYDLFRDAAPRVGWWSWSIPLECFWAGSLALACVSLFTGCRAFAARAFGYPVAPWPWLGFLAVLTLWGFGLSLSLTDPASFSRPLLDFFGFPTDPDTPVPWIASFSVLILLSLAAYAAVFALSFDPMRLPMVVARLRDRSLALRWRFDACPRLVPGALLFLLGSAAYMAFALPPPAATEALLANCSQPSVPPMGQRMCLWITGEPAPLASLPFAPAAFFFRDAAFLCLLRSWTPRQPVSGFACAVLLLVAHMVIPTILHAIYAPGWLLAAFTLPFTAAHPHGLLLWLPATLLGLVFTALAAWRLRPLLQPA